jgi:hypothetical protein
MKVSTAKDFCKDNANHVQDKKTACFFYSFLCFVPSSIAERGTHNTLNRFCAIQSDASE